MVSLRRLILSLLSSHATIFPFPFIRAARCTVLFPGAEQASRTFTKIEIEHEDIKTRNSIRNLMEIRSVWKRGKNHIITQLKHSNLLWIKNFYLTNYLLIVHSWYPCSNMWFHMAIYLKFKKNYLFKFINFIHKI